MTRYTIHPSRVMDGYVVHDARTGQIARRPNGRLAMFMLKEQAERWRERLDRDDRKAAREERRRQREMARSNAGAIADRGGGNVTYKREAAIESGHVWTDFNGCEEHVCILRSTHKGPCYCSCRHTSDGVYVKPGTKALTENDDDPEWMW